MVNSILEALVNVSEKAANIARAFRQDEHLFGLLVQEKSSEEGGNPRFVHDYKTLADVLIQEAIRHDIGLAVSAVSDVGTRKRGAIVLGIRINWNWLLKSCMRLS